MHLVVRTTMKRFALIAALGLLLAANHLSAATYGYQIHRNDSLIDISDPQPNVISRDSAVSLYGAAAVATLDSTTPTRIDAIKEVALRLSSYASANPDTLQHIRYSGNWTCYSIHPYIDTTKATK